MPPTYYRGCWHVVSRGLFLRYSPYSSLRKEVYDPKAFILHAASLHQAFAHCGKFPAAASRRSGGRVSVPLWLIVLSYQLPVLGLVGNYPTNYLIGRELIFEREQLPVLVSSVPFMKQSVRGISTGFPVLSPSQRQITHVLLSRLPLETTASGGISFDLHALGVPPTFVLSQDQTLRKFNGSSTHCSIVKERALF